MREVTKSGEHPLPPRPHKLRITLFFFLIKSSVNLRSIIQVIICEYSQNCYFSIH